MFSNTAAYSTFAVTVNLYVALSEIVAPVPSIHFTNNLPVSTAAVMVTSAPSAYSPLPVPPVTVTVYTFTYSAVTVMSLVTLKVYVASSPRVITPFFQQTKRFPSTTSAITVTSVPSAYSPLPVPPATVIVYTFTYSATRVISESTLNEYSLSVETTSPFTFQQLKRLPCTSFAETVAVSPFTNSPDPVPFSTVTVHFSSE